MLCHRLPRGGRQAAPEFVGGGIGVPGHREMAANLIMTPQHEGHHSFYVGYSLLILMYKIVLGYILAIILRHGSESSAG